MYSSTRSVRGDCACIMYESHFLNLGLFSWGVVSVKWHFPEHYLFVVCVVVWCWSHNGGVCLLPSVQQFHPCTLRLLLPAARTPEGAPPSFHICVGESEIGVHLRTMDHGVPQLRGGGVM
jgi:hypothetical protein